MRIAKSKDAYTAMHRFKVERFGEHLANGKLPTNILHFAVIAYIEFGRFES